MQDKIIHPVGCASLAYFFPLFSMAKAATKGNSPTVSFRSHGVGVSVFATEGTSKSGKPFTAYSATVTRRYVTKDGEVKYTSSLNERDWPIAASLLERAFWHVGNMKQGDDENAD